MTAAASSESPRTDQGECAPLLSSAHLGIYRENTFRITGLPVDATEREIKKQAGRLKMMEELGQAEATHAYALQPPPTADQIRAAMQRLKEPELRLIDEFFWFWPNEFGKSAEDRAIQAIQRGDANEAHQIWTAAANGGKNRYHDLSILDDEDVCNINRYVAGHNLAVLYHMAALDWTLFDLKQAVDPEREKKIERHWRDSFQYWERVAVEDDIWEVLRTRVAALEDPRLTTGFVRRMRISLPMAFDKINAEAALRFAELVRMDWARKHIAFMNETHQGLDDVEKTTQLVLAPARKRVKQLMQAAQDQTNSNPHDGLAAATKLLDACKPLQDLFEIFHGRESHHQTDLFDEVAETVNICCVRYAKASGEFAAPNAVLQRALSFATAPKLRELIQKNKAIWIENLRAAELAPVYSKLNKVKSSEDGPTQRLGQIKSTVLPLIAKAIEKEGASDVGCIALQDAAATVLRGISVDAYNENSDYITALAAIKLASLLVQNDENRRQIEKELRLLTSAVQDADCFFCKTRPASKVTSIPVEMYGDVTRDPIAGMINYRHTTVHVPRCPQCSIVGFYLNIASILSLIVGMFVAVILASSLGASGAAVFVIAGVLGTAAALITKHIFFGGKYSSYPRIDELMRKRWYFGKKPNAQ